jgi:hypothetical protein
MMPSYAPPTSGLHPSSIPPGMKGPLVPPRSNHVMVIKAQTNHRATMMRAAMGHPSPPVGK